MASKDSDQLDPKSGYDLGNYRLVLEVDDSTGGPAMEVTARCTDTETGAIGTFTKQLNSGTKIIGWYVEANENTASVYIIIGIPKGDPERKSPPEWGDETVSSIGSVTFMWNGREYTALSTTGIGLVTYDVYGFKLTMYSISSSPSPQLPYSITYQGKTAYYTGGSYLGATEPSSYYIGNLRVQQAIWTILYGKPTGDIEYDTKEILIAQFPIDVDEAGGSGEDSDWYDPEDYSEPIEPDDPDYPDDIDPIEPDDPDYPDDIDPIEPDDPDYPEPDDPDYPGDQDGDGEPDPYYPPYYPPYDPDRTLYLRVLGATSGRHNNPLDDSSYSYVPQNNDTQANYGCGGNGGHGGGGGAGASTVIIHKFATSRADSKELIAIARGHGYGSGGGAGGKGGDGCILIYY